MYVTPSSRRKPESRVPDENRDPGYKWFPAFAGTTSGFPRVKRGASLIKPGMKNKPKKLLTHHSPE